MVTIEFKELDYIDEFILDPQSIPDGQPILVYMKYGGGDGRDCGVTPDMDGSYQEYFEPDQKVIKVYATTAYKLKRRKS